MTTKISTLPTLATVTDATIIPVVEGGATKRITGLALKTYTGTAAGPQGPQGPAGSNGASGPQGPSGPSGAAGSGASTAEPAALGTVYGKTLTSAPYTTSFGYQAGNSTTGGSNTALGFQALYTNAGGTNNVAIGFQTGYYNTTGASNTAVGNYALEFNTTGNYNTAVGVNALLNNTTAANNAAIGYDALYSNTTGVRNVAVGRDTLRYNIAGNNNTAVGMNALYSNTADNSTAVGYNALYNLTTGGVENTAVGYNSLYNCTTGYYNTAVGHRTMETLTTGGQNVALGYNALLRITTGQCNTALGAPYVSNGWYPLQALTTGNFNTAVGGWAGNSITTGGYNVCLGTGAGGSTVLSTGSGNVCIGYEAAPSSSGATNQIVIGDSVTGQGNNYVVLGAGASKIYNAFNVNATWTQTSDARLKTNVQNDSLGLSFINRLRPVTFNWKASNEIDQSLPYYNEKNKRDTETVIHGLIAQEVKAALDAEGCATFNGWDGGNEDTVQGISREMFISPLIKAIQELSAEVASLKSQLNQLKQGN